MPNRRFLLTGVFAGVIVVGLVAAWALGNLSSAPDEPVAPDFTVEMFDGGTFSLSRHLEEDGRPLILNLWASWCLPCRVEMPDISAYATANPNITVLGVAVEDRWEDAVGFAEEVQVSYLLAFGDQEFRDDYPSIGLPATYFINPDGTVAGIINGIVTEESLDAGFG